MDSFRSLLIAMFLGAIALVMSACGPTYPKCDNDENCSDKGEYCLQGQCQQCREDSHCSGPGMRCASGSCERVPGYCDDSTPCSGKQKCRDNQCGAECLGNNECAAGQFCDSGSCATKPECGENADNPTCADGKECVGGICKIKIVQCGGDPVYFDFDRSNIKSGETDKLTTVAECLKGDNTAPLTIAGHCDERGTEEYNMALGERRAQAARKYLERLGVAGGKLNTISYGKERPAADGSNESAWSKNRRAEFSAQ